MIGRHRLNYAPVFNRGHKVMSDRYEDLRAPERWELLYRTELGPDKVEEPASEAEMTLLGIMRRLGIRPDEAIVRLVKR